MNRISVVIPSRTASNFVPCMNHIRENQPDARIILVDDGIGEAVSRWKHFGGGPDVILQGEKPFCFSRNVNIGITAAGDDDLVIINDDALLKTKDGLAVMQRAAYENPEIGLVGSTTNVTGNNNQRPHGIGLRWEPRIIPFICVFVPRRTIDQVGLMDERFGGLTPDGKKIYGHCDNDMCRRIRNAGLKLAIHDGCFVDHAALKSTFRGDPYAAGDISASRELYLQKWGTAD